MRQLIQPQGHVVHRKSGEPGSLGHWHGMYTDCALYISIHLAAFSLRTYSNRYCLNAV